MRTIIKNGVTMQYPDEIGFAFNPCLIVARGDSVDGMNISIAGHTVQYDAYGGVVYADIRAYIQGLFEGVDFFDIDYTGESLSNLGKSVSITVTAGGETFNFSTFYVWGVMRPGDTYNYVTHLTYFQGMPFTVGLYADNDGSGQGHAVLFKNDGKATSLVNIESGEGVYELVIPKPTAQDSYEVWDFHGTLSETTFTDIFDLTFSKKASGILTIKSRIKVMPVCGEGVYLRWIDAHGFFRYYYFLTGDVDYDTGTAGEYIRNNLLAWDASYGYNGGNGCGLWRSLDEKTKLCAPLVDKETWELLSGILTSPVVEMLMSWDGEVAEWTGVIVEDGNHTMQKPVLQDFEIEMKMPTTYFQHL